MTLIALSLAVVLRYLLAVHKFIEPYYGSTTIDTETGQLCMPQGRVNLFINLCFT